MRFVPKVVFTAFAIFLLSHSAFAADSPKPLFASDDVLSLTLRGPFDVLSRKPDAKPVSGLLRVGGATPEALPLSLSARGVTRRRPDICGFPPLRLGFTPQPGKDSLFQGQKQLKLVTHCQLSDQFEQYVLLEYAAYRLYRALTPESFGVRLAQIHYAGEDGRTIFTRMGFFIEDIDDVAHRNSQKRLKGVAHITATQVDPEAASRYAVFQYMISNLDWAMTLASLGEVDCCHNSRLVAPKGATADTTGLITVPYDFDYSGLVNAPYAVPPSNSGVNNVRTRRYRGFCRYNAQAQAFAATLVPRRAELLAIAGQTPQLNDRSKARAAEYLGEFFDQIASPTGVAAMLKTCL